MAPILVINPNSNVEVTRGLNAALDYLRFSGAVNIECLTLSEGPFGIESQSDVDSVILPLVRMVKAYTEARAIIIACYSDPGLDACRSAANCPVFGIQEAAVLTAMARADQFGIIAVADVSIHRHYRSMSRMAVLPRFAGEIALNMSVAETVSGPDTFDRMLKAGRELIQLGAGSIILGCAGMAAYRYPIEEALNVPVIDPTQAAVAMALGSSMPKHSLP